MGHHGRRAIAVLLALAAVASTGCGGSCDDGTGVRSSSGKPTVLVAGMGLALDEFVLREPVVPTLVGGGTPPPPEPIEGLDAAVAKALPEQVRGSHHPWDAALFEVLAPRAISFEMRLEDRGTWRGGAAPAPPLWSERLDVAAAERFLVLFAVGPQAEADGTRGLRRVLLRSREGSDGVWRVVGSDTREARVDADALPAGETGMTRLDTAGPPVGSYLAVARSTPPYVVAAFAWMPRRAGGTAVNVTGRAGEIGFTLDDLTYRPDDWPHALWALVLEPRDAKDP